MQHVICIKWSADSKYILSGSDEMNIRLWKANAAEKLGVVSPVRPFPPEPLRLKEFSVLFDTTADRSPADINLASALSLSPDLLL